MLVCDAAGAGGEQSFVQGANKGPVVGPHKYCDCAASLISPGWLPSLCDLRLTFCHRFTQHAPGHANEPRMCSMLGGGGCIHSGEFYLHTHTHTHTHTHSLTHSLSLSHTHTHTHTHTLTHSHTLSLSHSHTHTLSLTHTHTHTHTHEPL